MDLSQKTLAATSSERASNPGVATQVDRTFLGATAPGAAARVICTTCRAPRDGAAARITCTTRSASSHGRLDRRLPRHGRQDGVRCVHD